MSVSDVVWGAMLRSNL